MKFIKSIVILKRGEPGAQVIEVVLLIKHPEGCDPVELLCAAMHEFLQNEGNVSVQIPKDEFTWSDLIQRMQGWDWSRQALHIEEAPMWAVVDREDSLLFTDNRTT